MEGKSFLPDGSPIRARLLVRAPYAQETMEKIAKGAAPSSFEQSLAQNGTWGVLYVSDSLAGFFSARTEPSMLGFSLNAGADTGGPIHLQFPADDSITLEIIRAKRMPGKIGAFLAKIVASDDIAIVRWNGKDGPQKIMMFIVNGDLDEFERAFRSHVTGR